MSHDGAPGLAESTMAVVRTVRARVEAVARGERAAGALGFPPGSAFALLATRFGLDRFELGLLALAAAAELSPGFDALCVQVQGTGTGPSLALALVALDGARWDALLPDAPLRLHRLIRLGDGETLTSRPLRLPEPVLHALLGHESLDPELEGRVVEVPIAPSVEPDPGAVDAVVAAWASADLVPWVACADRAEAVAVVGAAAARLGRRLLHIPAATLPTDPHERAALAHLCARDARLGRVAWVIEDADEARLRLAPAGFGAYAGQRAPPGPCVRIPVEEADFPARRAAWAAGLPGVGDDRLDELAHRYRVGPTAIAEWTSAASLTTHPLAHARETLRRVSRAPLDDLAQRIPTRARFDDLVLPDAQLRLVQSLVSQVRHAPTVLHRWGFADARGSGTSAVFAGPSGTGKTLAAEVIAGVLDLDLYRVDLSAVVSKYIGETEKNLRRVFDAAETGGVVLLFDEADALFGKRTEVRDSHDRHANIEVSYLLQRMETYGGLALLTTNFKKALDDAFLRRIPVIVEFPFPDMRHREQIWRRVFPAATPTSSLDFQALSRLAVTGGNIRSIARTAAFLAADRAGPVTMEVLLEAARIECLKLGRTPTPAEVAGWRG